MCIKYISFLYMEMSEERMFEGKVLFILNLLKLATYRLYNYAASYNDDMIKYTLK